ncbi:restriction endonuclease subunit S [Bradyrhizobium sp. 138]|uniref:restriction endonuclease subunit S n=1 Tax=Bradyrhizobium sp. 138 TaxID=2782615 RepID=UPI001FFA13C7|nr:restriction endonuclease subunit S [Bradyrhizobium sp. 138]MCK1737992.1 restriction endonuclease subunit S [Bradyrhizobium sp. 138]
MIEGLRPYPEMKPSGLLWIGDVPTHWDVFRSKYIFREVDGRSMTGEETHLSMSQRLGLVPASQVEKSLVSESYVGAKLVEKEDLVLNRLKAHLGVFACAKQSGLISPDYTVLRPKPRANVRFFEYVLKSAACRTELRVRAKGIVEGFWRLYTDDFYDIRLPVPPLEEQRLIVRFLDWHGARATKLIRAKKKVIALLDEQKQEIIHGLVTRGLDPNVKFKSSGVSWVRSVPEHWQMLPNRAFLKKRKSLVGDAHNQFQLLSLTKKGVIVRDVESGKGKFSADMGTSQIVSAGDIIFCLFDIPETPRTVGLSRCEGMITGAYTVFSFKGSIDPEFVELFYIAMDDRKLLGPLYTGLRNTIAPSRFIGIKMPVPPIEEQIAIVEAVRAATAEINAAISKIVSEVSLIEEFRARLIADAVTGKLDVRTTAASLSDTIEVEAVDDVAEDDDIMESEVDSEDEAA